MYEKQKKIPAMVCGPVSAEEHQAYIEGTIGDPSAGVADPDVICHLE